MRRDNEIDRTSTARAAATDRTTAASTRDDRGLYGSTQGRLCHLDETDDFKVADGEPDIRGWDVRAADGRKIGKVEDLIVDTAAMKVRYVEVELDDDVVREARGTTETARNERRVLVPIGSARLNDDRDDVLLGHDAAQVVGMPRYQRGRFDRDFEQSLVGGRAAAKKDEDFYGHKSFDDREFFGKRRTGRDDAAYVTRSEEELRTGKRTVQAGTVGVHKSVETERVHQNVPVTHEEVTVERRPISADTARDGRARISEDEVRIPVMEEQVVTEKRVVPKEEVVVRKHAETRNESVDATVRKERIHVDKDGVARDDRTDRDARR